jgi:NADPH-dependent 2,4-dienoyl-CoA reductase/sulfur reductase-like enzyme
MGTGDSGGSCCWAGDEREEMMDAIRELPIRWRRVSRSLEIDKRKVKWESEEYLSHCAVQSTLERCADQLAVALQGLAEKAEQPK